MERVDAPSHGGTSPEDNPWAPPRSDPSLPPARARRPWLAVPEGIVVGLILGVADCHYAVAGPQSPDLSDLAYFVVALVLGARHGIWAWLAWPSLGVFLYLTHLVAIANGYKPPYVEESAYHAIACLIVLIPTGVGIGLGALCRWGVKTVVWCVKTLVKKMEKRSGARGV
jgi:hypothetical protein